MALKILFLLAAATLAVAFGWASAAATTTVALDEALIEHVESLTPVEGSHALETGTLNNAVVVVTFFASWCPPCVAEFADLNALASEFDTARLRIVAINAFEAWDDNDAARMQRFVALTRPTFPLLSEGAETRDRFGGIERIPTVFVFAPSGTSMFSFVHARGATKMTASLDELRRAVRQAFAEP